MSNRWWFSFDGMEQVAFKPRTEGFLYRAPTPWLVGRGRYFVVTDAQKSDLATLHRRMLRFLFWAIVVCAAAAGPLASIFTPAPALTTLAVAMLVGLGIGFAANRWLASKVRPILSSLTPTSEWITQADAFRTQMAVYSPRSIVGYGLLSLALLALSVLDGIYGSDGWNLYPIVGIVLFGAATVYWAVCYVAQRLRRTGTAGQATC